MRSIGRSHTEQLPRPSRRTARSLGSFWDPEESEEPAPVTVELSQIDRGASRRWSRRDRQQDASWCSVLGDTAGWASTATSSGSLDRTPSISQLGVEADLRLRTHGSVTQLSNNDRHVRSIHG
jgi:hypothetical protein